MNTKRNFWSIFILPLTLFFIYNVKFINLPPTIYLTTMVLFILAIWGIVNNQSIPKKLAIPLFLYFIFVLFVFLSAIKNGGNTHIYFNIGVIFISFFVAPYAYCFLFKNNKIKILKYISWAGIINALMIIIMFLFPNIRGFYLSLLSSSGLLQVYNNIDINTSYYALRMLGLTGSATYGMAVTQITLSFVYSYYILATQKKINIVNIITLNLLIVSAILSGRTAFIGIPILFIYLLKFTRFKDMIKIITVNIFIFAILLFFAALVLPDNYFSFFLKWFTEFFQKGMNVGSLQSNLNMYIYTLEDFSLLGDFKLHSDDTKSAYYMNTDIGWYRLLFAFGYLGSISFLLFFISLFDIKTTISKKNGASIAIGIFLIIVMFKGAILLDFYIAFFILCILYIYDDGGNNNESVNSF